MNIKTKDKPKTILEKKFHNNWGKLLGKALNLFKWYDKELKI